MDNMVERFIEINELLDCLSKNRDMYLKKCSNIGRMECSLLNYLSSTKKAEYMNTFSEKLKVSHSRITRIVDNLVKKRLVKRFPDPVDRRRWCAEITPAGIEVTAISSDKEIELQKKILDQIPQKKLASMEKNIRKYCEIFLKEFGKGEGNC
ncbi:MAG: MarR family transcriptional regulator [Candidatus Cloacimonadota bacterium]|nr:MarR family transcriptional regulator [Candidatus Cloacimonadota bacterium]